MLTKFQIFSPFPKRCIFKKEEENISCFFDYKKYVSMKKVCENLLLLDDDNLYSALAKFSKNHYDYRDTLYYNLQDIEIEEVCDNSLAGYYILSDTDNVMGYRRFSDIYHELLHVSSSSIDKKNNILYSGFGYYDFNKNIDYGEGLTEGYIELLVSRDLYNDKSVNNYDLEKNNFNVGYCCSVAIARQLEIIVGKENLEDMFFKNGFLRLKEFLMQYKPEKEVMKFLKNCDAATIADGYHNILLNNKVLEAQRFLSDICYEYMPEKKELLAREKLIKENDLGTKLTTPRICEEINLLKENKHK